MRDLALVKVVLQYQWRVKKNWGQGYQNVDYSRKFCGLTWALKIGNHTELYNKER